MHDHLVQVGQTAHMGRLLGLLSWDHHKLEHIVVQHMDRMHSADISIQVHMLMAHKKDIQMLVSSCKGVADRLGFAHTCPLEPPHLHCKG